MCSSLTKKFKFTVLSLTLVLSFLMVAQAVLAAGPTAESTGLDTTAKGGFGEGVTTGDINLSLIIGKIVGTALAFLGVIFFILIIYGGYTWMFSMGNEQTVGKAKSIIIAAVVGLIIVLMAYAITTYLGGAVGA